MYPKFCRLRIVEEIRWCIGKFSVWVVGVCIQNLADLELQRSNVWENLLCGLLEYVYETLQTKKICRDLMYGKIFCVGWWVYVFVSRSQNMHGTHWMRYNPNTTSKPSILWAPTVKLLDMVETDVVCVYG